MAQYLYQQTEHDNPLKSSITLDGKTLTTPFYGALVRSDIDLECLRELAQTGKLKNTQVVCYTLAEADRFKHSFSKGLFEFTGQTVDFRPLSEFILTIDPVGEYLQYNVKSETEKLLNIKDLPQSIKKILQSEGKERTRRIKELFDNGGAVAEMVEWYLRKSISYGSKTAIPPCLPISGAATLRYAMLVNRLAVTIQEANEWQKTVYFLLDAKALANPSILSQILDQIEILAPNIIVFKIYNPQFYDGDRVSERINLTEFIDHLYLYRQTKKSLIFGINVDAVGYHYLARGLCGFIEPISGNFNPDIRFKGKSVDLEEKDGEVIGQHLGRYPHPLKLTEHKFEDLSTMSKNTGDPLPCHCAECSRYDRLPTEARVFNRMRRKHRVLIRDTFIDELNTAVEQGTLRESIFDRFSESPRMTTLKSFYE